MKISVVMTTNRLGGFDLLYYSLMEQRGIDSKDWELIVVDEYIEERKGLLEWDSTDHKRLNVKHLGPDKKQDFTDPCHCINTALRRCEGELVVFITDMQWLEPYFLARHWGTYNNYTGCSMSGYLDRYPIPKLRPVEDPLIGWTIFDPEFTPENAGKFFAATEPSYRERKGGIKGGIVSYTPYREMPGQYVYFNVDSLPLEILKDLNGWDERYDGGYGLCDIDLGVRANLHNWKFVVIEDSVSYKLGVQGTSHVLPHKSKPHTKTVEDNRRFYETRMRRIAEFAEGLAVPDGFGAWR